jgi:hypothetical protein
MNYQELVTATTEYADRSDIEVGDNMATFILMAEARINRVLKTREQSVRATTPTVTDQYYYALPPDYAGMRDVQLNFLDTNGNAAIAQYFYINPEQMNERSQAGPGGKNYYTIIANQMQIWPAVESGNNIEMVYYQKVPPLSEANPNNWASDDQPDIYLAGMVAEVELFVKNYDVAKGWHDRMSLAISELDSSDTLERWAGQPLVTRVG